MPGDLDDTLEAEVLQLVTDNLVKSTSHLFKNNVIFRAGNTKYFKGVNGVPLVKEGESMVWFGEEENAMMYTYKHLKPPNGMAISTSFKLKHSHFYFLKLSSVDADGDNTQIMNAALITKIVDYLALKDALVDENKEHILNAYGVNFEHFMDLNNRTLSIRFSNYFFDRVFAESLMNHLILPVYNKLPGNHKKKVIGYFHDDVFTYPNDELKLFKKECVIHKSFLKTLFQNQTVTLKNSKRRRTDDVIVLHSLAGGCELRPLQKKKKKKKKCTRTQHQRKTDS